MLTLEELLSLIGHDRWQDIVLSAGNVFFCLEPVLDGEAVVCGHVADFEKLHSQRAQRPGFSLRLRAAGDPRVRLPASTSARPEGVTPEAPQEGSTRGPAQRAPQRRWLDHLRSRPEARLRGHREPPYHSGRSKSWLKTKNPDSPAMLRLVEDDG
jgi:hypothetical protein